VGLAVAVVPHAQPDRRLRLTFLAFEQLCFVRVSGVGVDDFEDPAAEGLQRFGVELVGVGEQPPLGLLVEVGVEVCG